MDDHVGSSDSPLRQPTQADAPKVRGGLRRFASILGSGVCLSLAAIGFFLPVLPCTPFVLLASFLLMRGSPALHQKLKSSRFFGRILVDWEDRKGIRPADKVRAVVVVVSGLILTITFGNLSPLLKFVTLFLVTIGLWVILRLPLAQMPDE